ncbi:hypothetical protein G7Y89_g10982 [Cudoniella acicularis]|uniref:Exonuclease domain-containing protein n=1 Tax=Cudoniella acicularis TaxID=354080 RepID=A0A8H4REE0_9HELO|nr:hypothetical protein G7Y89_g10982 [Cudoniella acicularis]
MQLFEFINRSPSDVFIVDIETGFDGVVHEVGAVTLKGFVVVDTSVNYGMSLYDFYKLSQNDLSEDQQFRAFCTINKTYRPPNRSEMKGSTLREILEYLMKAGMTADSIWVEHSFGNFDYKRSRKWRQLILKHNLPLEQNVFSTLDLWRLLLPGLFSHQQSHLFSLLRLNDPAISGKRHISLPDTLMCREILRVAIDQFNLSMNQ